ncbi:MAG: response regulator transcription factor [Lachnospiraceae bacterium]
MKKKLSIVVENDRLKDQIKSLVEMEKYDVYFEDSRRNILNNVTYVRPDIVIIDMTALGGDLYPLGRCIKKKTNAVFIGLGEKNTLIDETLGFDDYIEKPFQTQQLYNKIKRLSQKKEIVSKETEESKRSIIIDSNVHSVIFNGNILNLAPMEFALLRLLLLNRNHVVERKCFMENLWGEAFVGSERLVDTHIKLLRKKLGVYSSQLITVQKVGYLLSVDPEIEIIISQNQ